MGSFEPAVSMFSGGIAGWLKYWWVFAIVAFLGITAGVLFWISKWKQKNSQWSHKLLIKDELPNGEINQKERIVRMRRWKHKERVTAPLFELEKPIFGSRIFTELEAYSGPTTYSIVAGNDGRIYIPTKIVMCKDKQALEVSVKHAGIDRARQKYSNDFEKTHATPKKVDMLTLLKYGMYITIAVIIMIVCIQGLKSWGERANYEAEAANAEAAAWAAMGDTMDSVEAALNTVTLIMPDLKKMYGNNLQGAIKNRAIQLNNQS